MGFRSLIVASMLLLPTGAQAMLVKGDALAHAHNQVLRENTEFIASFDLTVGEVGRNVSVDFTPRQTVGLAVGNQVSARFGDVGLSFGFSGSQSRAATDQYSTHGVQARLRDQDRLDIDPEQMVIGGALQYEDWEVGSGFVQTDVFGLRTGLWSAKVGYGSLQAGVAFGQQETDAELRDVMMLNTDVDALSWLKVYGDVAIANGEEDESIAVGRVGIRLKF